MKTYVRIAIGLLVIASAADTVQAAAQRANPQAGRRAPRGVLTLPATGTFADGGEFSGTISISRFERLGNDIVAIGVVAGVLRRGSQSMGTAVAGQLAWPVDVSAGGLSLVSGRPPAAGGITRVAWSPEAAPAAALRRVQAETCPVLNITIGEKSVTLLGGIEVVISPVTIDLNGIVGTALGDLVCEAEDLLGNVVAIVALLNAILDLLTGLLGLLIGGIGAIIPTL